MHMYSHSGLVLYTVCILFFDFNNIFILNTKKENIKTDKKCS